jgi:hypothetical protein
VTDTEIINETQKREKIESEAASEQKTTTSQQTLQTQQTPHITPKIIKRERKEERNKRTKVENVKSKLVLESREIQYPPAFELLVAIQTKLFANS